MLKTRDIKRPWRENGTWDDPGLLPTAQGFDTFLGLPYSNDMWPVDYNGQPVDTSHRKAGFSPLPLIRNGHKETVKSGMLTRWYTNFAVGFIRHQKI
jgi:arylsulfatase